MENLLESWLNEILREELKDNIPTLLESGMSPEQVAQETGLSVEDVLRLSSQHSEQERGTENQ